MGSITRRSFIRHAGTLPTLATFPASAWAVEKEGKQWQGGEVGNSVFRLFLSPREGLRKTRLVHVPSGLVLADADYSYSFARPQFERNEFTNSPDGSSVVRLWGVALGRSLEVLQEFRVPGAQPWIEEQITLTNRGLSPLDLGCVRGGFVLPLADSRGKIPGIWGSFNLTAIPFRREPNGNRTQYACFSLAEVLTEQYSSELWTNETTTTSGYASEGWAWTDGKQGFLLTKYSQKGMEWSVLDRVPVEGNQIGLRWGGCGIYRGNPQHGAWVLPGESYRFGVTRLTAYKGGMPEGFYTFRQEMAARGHGCPADYDPPVHWNELYDNKLWWLSSDQQEQDDPAMRKKYYTLADMKEEAAKAKAIGCESLYMDPGWDTNFGSKIWDTARLGPYPAFTQMLREDYGLKSSLHTPLSGWCDASSYPSEMYRMDRLGRRLGWRRGMSFVMSPLCGASKQYLEETARRLNKLAEGGAAFFMFDGTMYHGECWDPKHGHGVPARREEHVQGLCRLARMVHAEHPRVLIEMHDPMVGGNTARYAPIYYGHGHAPEGERFTQEFGFDCVWAFELMWSPMDDLLSGRSIALYYYNLAYSLPLYIHIDLRTDNANGLVFWWNASTCRHLGIGGTHKDPAVNQAHREAMVTYRRLESFFKRGTFYGIDELAHVHVHPSQSAAVINCFNLEDRSRQRELEFVPERYGLDPKRNYKVQGVPTRAVQDGYTLMFSVPAMGHQLAEIWAG